MNDKIINMDFINIENYNKEIEIIKNIFLNSYEKAGGKGHRFYHLVRVAHNVIKISETIKISPEEKDILVLAALYHDIGKASRIKEDGYLDGSQKADLAHGNHTDEALITELLVKYLIELHSKEKLSKIAQVISSKESDLSKVLSDSDNLDEVGLVNVWKMFTFGGGYKVDIKDTVEYYFNHDRERLISKVDKEMFFDISKQIAKKRIQLVDDTLNLLIQESKGDDIS